MVKYPPFNPGDKVNMLTLIKKVMHKGRTAWLCCCDCGKETIVLEQNLKNKTAKSCGCYNRKAAAQRMHEARYKHGKEPRRLYECWRNLRRRCAGDSTGKGR